MCSHTIRTTTGMPDGAYKTETMRLREANFPILKKDSNKNGRQYSYQTSIEYFFEHKSLAHTPLYFQVNSTKKKKKSKFSRSGH